MDQVDSTNEYAEKSAGEGSNHGQLIIATTQLQGQGRFQRQWHSPRGGLWWSLVLHPPVADPSALTVIFGASTARALGEILPVKPSFKWPNDIYIGNRKLGGILLKSHFSGSRLDWVIAGIGINGNYSSSVLGEDLPTPAITLMEAAGREVDLNQVLAHILAEMETDYLRFVDEGPSKLINENKHNCSTIGQRVKILRDEGPDLTGTAMDLGTEGGLVIRTADNWTVVINNARQLIYL